MTLTMTELTVEASVRVRGEPSPSDLEKIRNRAPDPSAVTADRVFAWDCIVASDIVDRRYLRLTSGSLDKIVRSLSDGISFQGSDERLRLPLAQSYAGRRDGGRAIGSFFTLRGVHTGSVDSDSWIAGVRAGIFRAVRLLLDGSGSVRCSVCNADPLGSRCGHTPGQRYGADGKPSKRGEPMHLVIDGAGASAVVATHYGADPAATVVGLRAARGEIGGRSLVLARMMAAGWQPGGREPAPPAGASAGRGSNAEPPELFRVGGRVPPALAAFSVGGWR